MKVVTLICDLCKRQVDSEREFSRVSIPSKQYPDLEYDCEVCYRCFTLRRLAIWKWERRGLASSEIEDDDKLWDWLRRDEFDEPERELEVAEDGKD